MPQQTSALELTRELTRLRSINPPGAGSDIVHEIAGRIGQNRNTPGLARGKKRGHISAATR